MREVIAWLFEKNVFEDGNPQRMAKLVHARQAPCAEVAFATTPDGDDLRPLDPIPFPADAPVIVYGSMNLLRWLRRRGQWPRLAWYDFARLRCQHYYAHWGPFLLQRNYTFLPLAEVARRRDWIFDTFARDDAVFIRPDDNDKSFSGGVVHRADFARWYELANFYHPGPDCLAVISSPESIRAEYRFAIGDRKVITGSQYRRDGVESISPDYPSDAAAFAETVAASTTFNPHPVYAMDVCETPDGYRLVEIGSLLAASLYACDLGRIVDQVCTIARNEIACAAP
jgi:hypothetical protein